MAPAPRTSSAATKSRCRARRSSLRPWPRKNEQASSLTPSSSAVAAIERVVLDAAGGIPDGFVVTVDRVEMETKAPQSAGEWNDLADDAVRKAAAIVRRHRADGYR